MDKQRLGGLYGVLTVVEIGFQRVQQLGIVFLVVRQQRLDPLDQRQFRIGRVIDELAENIPAVSGDTLVAYPAGQIHRAERLGIAAAEFRKRGHRVTDAEDHTPILPFSAEHLHQVPAVLPHQRHLLIHGQALALLQHKDHVVVLGESIADIPGQHLPLVRQLAAQQGTGAQPF